MGLKQRLKNSFRISMICKEHFINLFFRRSDIIFITTFKESAGFDEGDIVHVVEHGTKNFGNISSLYLYEFSCLFNRARAMPFLHKIKKGLIQKSHYPPHLFMDAVLYNLIRQNVCIQNLNSN